MSDLTLVLCSVLSLAIAIAVLYKPLFREKRREYFTSDSNQQEFDEKLSLLEAISELETDYRMGKLSQEDFETMSLEFKRVYLEETTP